jgi:hypothetical protein
VITSAASAQFPTGASSSFTVTTDATEWPIPTLSESGALPSGVTFHDNGDGTATLTGTPTAAVAGSYPLEITASNGVAPDATQQFALAVGAAPEITSSNQTDFEIEIGGGSFSVTTTGDPTPGITESGALPSGINFQDNGDGTATFSGDPNEDNGPVIGTYPITLTASQPGGSSWPDTTQAFTLTVSGSDQPRPFSLNATVTDGTALNPGFGLAVNGVACHNEESGSVLFAKCGPDDEWFLDVDILGGRSCLGDPLPLATNLVIGNCYSRYLSWDPSDTVTISAPETTTVGGTTYGFAVWDTDGQSVPCIFNLSADCTFQVPSSGVNVTAFYTPLPP